MPTKTQRIMELFDETALSLSRQDNWLRFLKTAAWQYKYSFEDQLLIYAQRPDARACASIEVWNRNMQRWINRGARGIALFRENGSRYGLRYVFDVSDTNDRYNREVRLWQYDKQYDEAIIESLEDSFGELESRNTIYNAIKSAAFNAVQDNKADYISELRYVVDDSFLAELDDVNLDLRFRQTAAASVAYMIAERMGINDGIIDSAEFEHIRDFNTIDTIAILGSTVSSISETALREISQTIRAERNSQRVKFANQKETRYNETEINNERNDEHDRADIQDRGRLSASGAERTADGGELGQVRDAETVISEEKPQEPVHTASGDRQASRPSGGNRQNSHGAGGENSVTDGEERGRDRADESEGPDALGGTYEQFYPLSGGERTSGVGVQLNLFDMALPSEQEQRQAIEIAEQRKRSAFSLPQQIIDEVLTSGSNNRDSILNICTEYSKGKPNEENIEFLKKEYGTGGKGFVMDGEKISAWWNEEGIHIARGDNALLNRGTLLTWEQTDRRISALLGYGRYATQETLDKTDEHERNIAARYFIEMFRNLNYDGYPELNDSYNEDWLSGAYDVVEARISGLLKDEANVSYAAGIAGELTRKYYQNRDIVRFRLYLPEEALSRLVDLQLDHVHFMSDNFQPKNSHTFITQDEIDKLFMRGSSFDRGKIRIYLYFQEHSDKKARIDFLKSEYGTGGFGYGVFNEWHDGKGISFSRSDIASPLAKVKISWSNAEKRIDKLIKEGRYLTEKEIAEDVPRYQSEQEQQRVRGEKYAFLRETANMPVEVRRIMLEKRIAYFTELIDNYERGFFREYGVEGLLNNTDIGISDMIRDAQVRGRMIDCMKKIQGATSDAMARGNASLLAEELASLKNVTLHRVGDFYEVFGNDAAGVAEALSMVVTKRTINGERVDMTGFPVHIAESYINDLNKAGYIVDIADDEREVESSVKAEQPQEDRYAGVSDDLAHELFADGHRVYLSHGGEIDLIRSSEEINDHQGLLLIDNPVLLEKAQGLIRDFYEREYGDEAADFSDLHKVSLAYTTTEETEREIQVDADLVDYRIIKYLDNREIEREQFKDLYDMIENGLTDMSFDELVSVYESDIAEAVQEQDEQTADDTQTVEDMQTSDEQQTETEQQDNNDLIGKELEIEGRRFIIDSLEEMSGDVSLRDVTFQAGAGFPIFRVEKLDTVQRIMAQQEQQSEQASEVSGQTTEEKEQERPAETEQELTIEQEDTTEEEQEQTNGEQTIEPIPIVQPQPRQSRVQNTVIYPEITGERHNFRITDNELGVGGPKEKFRNNIAAIETLKRIEAEHRLATPEEQEVLSRYVGWGGVQDAFDESKESWRNEYTQLRGLLNDAEYASARESTLTAFYTPPVVIRAMYTALENMGMSQGNILDPAMGIGNFEGMLPDSMSACKVYGIEVDSISGRIAQQLYQNNSVAIQGYENTTLPDSFFDAAVGNIPFGDFKVLDKRYDRHNFLIHDYFFAKTLDKVRPGGVIAFVTSSGTMDKQNSALRRYIAQRADLVGAVRLPDNTFKRNAGTEVTSDILFLQKRDRMTDIMPEWVQLGEDENGHRINQYFVDNPDMILGGITEESGPFGPQLACKAYEGADLGELLNEAVQNIHAQITEYEIEDISDDEDLSIPADPNVKNFSYTVVDGEIYFRENSRMNKVDTSLTAQNRIKGMIEIRDCVRELIAMQTEDFPDADIKKQQDRLNRIYDEYTAKYGLISSRGNSMAFGQDSSYFILSALEITNENGELVRKADMFTKRTIGAKKEIHSVDTASEALAVSIGEKARVDMEFMQKLTGKTEQELFGELKGVIFLDPTYGFGGKNDNKYVPADEYLSGNVRRKLEIAKRSAEQYPDDYSINVEYLEKVQPKDLGASEITVRLGTTWIPTKYIEDFIEETLRPSYYARRQINVFYSKVTGVWNVSGKSSDKANVRINNTYGTARANALKIIEDTLNLRDVRIFDYVENENGSRVPVLNHKETTLAQQKQQQIKELFSNWIWSDHERRETLVTMYNEKFNSTRTREYDGSHIVFAGMNPEIQLRQHQKNAVARIMYGGNTLLGHVVGAGKTWTMAAAAMESRRLGLCNKPMFVVPNHLIEQWASEFLQLYPAANILVATKKDFEKKNRKRFCGRIATGDYDAIIMGHSQFEKIPMSQERQVQFLQRQVDEIIDGIAEAKAAKAEKFTVKQMVKTQKGLEAKLKKLNNTERKDDVVTFEELGVDRIFVDEAHYYKNLAAFSKMRNVGGISQTEAQKSSDMFMKCRYLDELTGCRGNIFATGTPLSNSMVELFTMQRYLQHEALERSDLAHFDAWASTFGETVTAIELAPEGTGYRAKTRFAKFYNIPELMNMFREVADIQTADMLNLPVPKAEYHNISVEPTEIQKEMVAELGKRADRVRNGGIDPKVDNMLTITNDGRKLALDQRLINETFPDQEGTKVDTCASKVYEIWEKTSDFNGTQLVFCDSSTPKADGSFNVYDDIRDKLIARGVPEKDIAFIHHADTDVKKKELFAKVRSGEVRILLGSTQKMGAGTNVQTLLYASHDLDCPWRPSDLLQRAGRIIRQGNKNETVHLYRYVTKDTFDAYSYQLVENKQKFIAQIMTSKSPVRSAEDIDETALSYAEIKALATGNPHIKEKMELDTDVAKLKLLRSGFMAQKYDLEDKVVKHYPRQIKELEARIELMGKDIETVEKYPKEEGKFNPMVIDGSTYTEKEKAGKAIIERCKAMTSADPVLVGTYRGFNLILSIDTIDQEHKLTLQGAMSHTISLGTDIFGNLQRIDNALSGFGAVKLNFEEKLKDVRSQFEIAKVESKKEFPREQELNEKLQRLAALDALLNMDKREPQTIDTIPDDEDMPKKKNREMER